MCMVFPLMQLFCQNWQPSRTFNNILRKSDTIIFDKVKKTSANILFLIYYLYLELRPNDLNVVL